ncbi:TetR family transcriptional regulator [Rhodococcoides trifolii]|uniref:TetR family transcriptional regulator n=1 Tax=Rhodococcoides trifolii TaxID=908250 RepID=A0A917G774_9NOCA|nr:TetR/AcrR family transcriptional regulator [Rhodococcus trifolii]GGG25296.1 TetR family transcriptional regulator [Rhodococcus trifolii]
MQVTARDQRPAARARREQIVAAAIDVIATSGYRSATFQTIAAAAGIKSTRTISYHFAGKDDLIAAVVEDVFSTITAFMAHARIATDSFDSALETTIRATVALNDAHRASMQALMSIFLEHYPAGGSSTYGPDEETAVMSPIQQVLVDGQKAGEFTDFDAEIMAATIQRSLDGVAFLLRTHPDLDLDHYADELVSTFRRATRR